ncbi:type III-B CRISPR module-associated Cmr3 family protein [Nocardia sp. NPDC050697]|uniref:type III-B CRISPR module-associated Cmr3 family protein n=1 Tax=Nocardia sp. NPDC050697 TaxID=3155158 RepID=UPI0033C63473
MTHPRVLVRATLTQATSPGAGSRGSYRNDIHDHIPGAVLRGACAAAWIRRHGPPAADDTRFLDIFEGTGTFGPLEAETTVRVPLSVRLHKYAPGPHCQRWWDQARGQTATSCPECGQDLTDSKGQRTLAVPRVARIHAALDPDGVALDEKLFETTGLAPGLTLSGWVSGPAVAALYHQGAPLSRLKLGGGRSTGGTATLTLDPDARPDPLETHDDTVILRLAAPGVFFDDFGFPAEQPSSTQLREAFGCAAEITGAWTRWSRIGGWHAASGLPKPTERAVAAGSTYTVRLLGTPDPGALERLRTTGIGARRREGFGALYTTPTPTVPASDTTPTATVPPSDTTAATRGDSAPAPERGPASLDPAGPVPAEPQAPGSLVDDTARARPITGFPGWPKIAGHLHARADRWPPDTAADARLLTAISKAASTAQTQALAALLAHRDRDHYLTVLDRIEAR